MIGKRKTSAIVVATSLLTLAIGLGAGYLLFGNGVAKNQSQAEVESLTVVCDNNIVSRYNAAMTYEIRDNEEQPSIDEDNLNTLITEIKGSKNYEVDPTCQTIVFWGAINAKNYDDANAAYQAVKSLHSQRHFADSSLRVTTSFSDYESMLDSISPDNSKGEESGGGL